MSTGARQARDDARFGSALAACYERHLVPLVFEPYAALMARRLAGRPLSRVLEIAAGTGVATRALADTLPPSVAIVATDLNQAMLDQAIAAGTSRPVEWRQADALALPFADASFDAVVCQFGAMFFPDRARAFAEARRVLVDGGLFVFSVWDRLEDNELADVVTAAVTDAFPDDPPRFVARTPHGYHDAATIRRDLAAGGFARPAVIETVAARSVAPSPGDAAIAFCQGTPLRNEIEARAPSRLAEVTMRAAEAVRTRFGTGPVDGRMQALVVTVVK